MTTSSRRRFSGPELAEVLQRVHDEHGDDVTITSVSRVRSGGLAGFFARETYEVEVSTDPARRRDDGGGDAPDEWSELAAGGIRMLPAQAGRGSRRFSDEDLAVLPTPSDEAHQALDLSDGGESLDRDDGGEASDRDGGGTAVDPADRFQSLLERRLAELDDTEPWTPVGGGTPRAGDRPATAAGAPATPVPATAVPVAPVPVTPVPVTAVPLTAVPVIAAPPVVPSVPVTGTAPSDRTFWSRLDRAVDELHGLLPPASVSTCVIGPLAHAAPVVRQLEHRRPGEPVPVHVLTPRAEVVSEPGWHLVRDGAQLARAAESATTPVVIVIDVDGTEPIWLEPLVARLRRSGIDLVRHVVPGRPTDRDIDRLLHLSSGPATLDLCDPVPPERTLRLLDRGVAVVSVGGLALGPEVLVALRAATAMTGEAVGG
ncbi:MAG: hypothetical protein ACFCVK_22710 [Acidimicrobiales bacterium]